MGLTRTDGVVLIVCLLAVVFTSRQDGDFALVNTWYHAIDLTGHSYQNGHAPNPSERVPLPVITDLDGDGLNEIILVTREPAIKVLRYEPSRTSSSPSSSRDNSNNPSGNNNDDDSLSLQSRASLLGRVAITSGRQPIGLATGYLQPYSETQRRTQVIVVVTEGWHVLCYTSSLQLMWERTVEADLGGRYIGEVAIAITSQQMLINDTGVVLIGGRLHARSDLVQHTIHNVVKPSDNNNNNGVPSSSPSAEFDYRRGATSAAREGQPSNDDDDDDKLADMINDNTVADGNDVTKLSRLARKLTIPTDVPSPSPSSPSPSSVTSSRRLLHGAPVDEEDPDHEGDQDLEQETLLDNKRHFGDKQHFSFFAFEGASGTTRWQHKAHDFMVESGSHDLLRPQHEVHSGELDWRSFRASILLSLPHQWSAREDTSFRLHHYIRRRSGRDRQRDIDEQKQATSWTTSLFGGILPHAASEHVRQPNAIVAHMRDGIEVIHLYTGRTLCRIGLKRGVAHVDMNGDGVVDHIESLSGSHISPYFRTRLSSHGFKLPSCIAMVTSGIPPTGQLFNTTVCRTTNGGGSGGIMNGFIDPNRANQKGTTQDEVRMATPMVMPLPKLRTSANGIASRIFQALFFVNSGEVTSVTANGDVKWRQRTRSSWLNDGAVDLAIPFISAKIFAELSSRNKQQPSDAAKSLRLQSYWPSITPVALREDGDRDHIIVAGQDSITLMSSHDGYIRGEASLIDVPTSRICVGDWSRDGITDVIIITPLGYYGLILEERMGSSIAALLLWSTLLLAVIVSVILRSKLTNGSGTSSRGARSGKSSSWQS